MTASCLQGLPSNAACGLSSNREQPIYSAPIPAIHIGCGWLTEAPRRAQVCRTDCTRESPSRHCIRGVLSQMLCGASPSSASTTFVDADYACPKDTLHYMRPAFLVHGASRQYNATAHTARTTASLPLGSEVHYLRFGGSGATLPCNLSKCATPSQSSP